MRAASRGIKTNPGIADGNPDELPPSAAECDRKDSAIGHGAQGVVAKVPKNLLHGVAVDASPQPSRGKMADDLIFAGGARVPLDEQQRFFRPGCEMSTSVNL